MKSTPELTRDNMKMRTDGAPPGYPPGHRLLVKIVAEEEMTEGKIIVIAKDKHACELADVLSVGRNAFFGYGDNHPWCQAGDRIYFVRHSGKAVNFINDREEYRVIQDEDVYYVCGNGSGGE